MSLSRRSADFSGVVSRYSDIFRSSPTLASTPCSARLPGLFVSREKYARFSAILRRSEILEDRLPLIPLLVSLLLPPWTLVKGKGFRGTLTCVIAV